MHLGYALSSEEHPAPRLVDLAVEAEARGFEFAMISDHIHPWIDRQGHSPFAWSVLGGIAARTERLWVGTGVTCPLIRMHPVLVAQAAMTVSEMMPGRFSLGLGSGEALNEHVTGERWPPASVRLQMFEEAIHVIRRLFTGEVVDHHGEHYTVEGARIYVDPQHAPRVLVAAGGTDAATLAGRTGDGLVVTSPDSEVREAFSAAGGAGPRIGQLTVCVHPDEDEAMRTVQEWWPNTGLPGQLNQELPMPSHFEQAVRTVRAEDLSSVVVGPDPDRHRKAIQEFADAGYDHVYVHQVGPDQQALFDLYERKVLPSLASAA